MHFHKMLAVVVIFTFFLGYSSAVPSSDITDEAPFMKAVILTDNDWRNIFYAAPIAARYKWPLVIYDESMDNQVENFVKSYNPSTILKFKAEFPDFGFNSQEISRENLVTTYLGDSNTCVIVSENDYATSLLAAGYASVRQIPLVFSSEFAEIAENIGFTETISTDLNFSGSRNLSYQELFEDYIRYAGSERLIMVDSEDIHFNDPDNWHATLSFLAPILAGYRQELILDIKQGLDMPLRPESWIVDKIKEILLSNIDNFNLKPKFLTIVADQRVIPYAFKYEVNGYVYYRSSNYFFSEIDNDYFEDLAVGVIIGYSATDANFLILRSVFFEEIRPSDKMTVIFEREQPMGTPDFSIDMELLSQWAGSIGWESKKYLSDPEENVQDILSDFQDSTLILYAGHGSEYGWAWETLFGQTGVFAWSIPRTISPSLIIAPHSCSNLEPLSVKNENNQFFIKLIRSGCVGYVGFVETVLSQVQAGPYASIATPLLSGYSLGEAFKGSLNSGWIGGAIHGKNTVIALIGDPLFRFKAGTIPTAEAKIEGNRLTVTLPSTSIVSRRSLVPLYSIANGYDINSPSRQWDLSTYFRLGVPSDFAWVDFYGFHGEHDLNENISLHYLWLESYREFDREFEKTYVLFRVHERFEYEGGELEGMMPSRTYVFKLPLDWGFYIIRAMAVLVVGSALYLGIKKWPRKSSRSATNLKKGRKKRFSKGLALWLIGSMGWAIASKLETFLLFDDPLFGGLATVGLCVMVLGPVVCWVALPLKDRLKTKQRQ